MSSLLLPLSFLNPPHPKLLLPLPHTPLYLPLHLLFTLPLTTPHPYPIPTTSHPTPTTSPCQPHPTLTPYPPQTLPTSLPLPPQPTSTPPYPYLSHPFSTPNRPLLIQCRIWSRSFGHSENTRANWSILRIDKKIKFLCTVLSLSACNLKSKVLISQSLTMPHAQ